MRRTIIMPKPVDKIEFWKERIETATRPHFSVYVANDNLWNRINESHEKILKDTIKGKVLDAGCGYGRWAKLFDEYTGIDFSPDFIEIAKKKNPGKLFIRADLKNIPFEDKEFDWAFCVSIKKMVEDNLGSDSWKQMQEELKRVAKNVLILEYEDYMSKEII